MIKCHSTILPNVIGIRFVFSINFISQIHGCFFGTNMYFTKLFAEDFFEKWKFHFFFRRMKQSPQRKGIPLDATIKSA